jgi:3-oxoacyl-(acyl-carrier-protein) synthase
MALLLSVMDKVAVAASSIVTEADLATAKLGSRFGRMDLLSQLALLSVEWLGIDFEKVQRDHVGVCMAVSAGSLSTDVEYWKGRNDVGGPSPTLFAYTLPSSAIGEIAIRYRLTGPNLCLVGSDAILLSEARDMILRGEMDSCVCIACNAITSAASELIRATPQAEAHALFLTRGTAGLAELKENDRDIESVCALVSRRESAGRTVP